MNKRREEWMWDDKGEENINTRGGWKKKQRQRRDT
jgi:hypothetical protein